MWHRSLRGCPRLSRPPGAAGCALGKPPTAPHSQRPAQKTWHDSIRRSSAARRSGGLCSAPTAQLTERGINVNAVRERLESLGEIVRAAPLVLGPGKIAFEFLVAAAVDAADA